MARAPTQGGKDTDDRLCSTQAMMTIPPWQVVPWHEPPLKEEGILILDYAPVQARGKGDAPTISRRGGARKQPRR
jgi:hypothetical protein